MANAETEDDEVSFVKDGKNRVIGKKPSKKLIFAGNNTGSGSTVNDDSSNIRNMHAKSNNFFRDAVHTQS